MFQENLPLRSLSCAPFWRQLAIILAAAVRILPHPWNFTPHRRHGDIFPARCFLIAASHFSSRLWLSLPAISSLACTTSCPSFTPASCSACSSAPGSRIAAAFRGSAAPSFSAHSNSSWSPTSPFGSSSAPIRTLRWPRRLLHRRPALFGDTLAGDAIYATLFFGIFALAEKLFPVLSDPAGHPAH